MESSGDRDYQDRRVGPTVSKEKWLNHAKVKMARGYVLIVGNQRKTANFYMRNKGFEMCPYNVAKQMIKDGLVVEAGEHHLGTMYRLADNISPVEAKRKRDAEEIPDEIDTIVDDFEEDTSTEEPPAEEPEY